MHNDTAVVIQTHDATIYRYDYLSFRRDKDSKPPVDEDCLEMVWQGFQIDQTKVVLDPIQMLSVQPHF